MILLLVNIIIRINKKSKIILAFFIMHALPCLILSTEYIRTFFL